MNGSKTPKIMKLRRGSGPDKYPRVTIQNKIGKKQVVRVHKLVESAFMPKPAPGHIVRHKTKSTSPALKNLEHGSAADNHEDKHRDKTDQRGARNSQAILKRSDVMKIKRMYKSKKFTQAEIADMFATLFPASPGHINIGNGHRKHEGQRIFSLCDRTK